MSGREKILNAIAANQPENSALPVIDKNAVISYGDVCLQFMTTLERIGGQVHLIKDLQALKQKVDTDKAAGKFVINTLRELGETDGYVLSFSAEKLEKLEIAYLRGAVGVAENGAVWLYESQMLNRLVPFICQHLALVIDKKDIVATMHHAYQKIDVAREGFGVFIAGPSKTADIEQSLVIGAHGARSATVYVIV